MQPKYADCYAITFDTKPYETGEKVSHRKCLFSRENKTKNALARKATIFQRCQQTLVFGLVFSRSPVGVEVEGVVGRVKRPVFPPHVAYPQVTAQSRHVVLHQGPQP